jgi:hypothetical protein
MDERKLSPTGGDSWDLPIDPAVQKEKMTSRAMTILDNILATALPKDYKYKIIQHDNRIIYTLIRDGRDYKFEIGWFVEDANHGRTRHFDQCLKDKIAIMETVDHEPTEDEYSWAFMPAHYAN